MVRNDAGLLPLSREPRDVLVTGGGVTTTRLIGEAIARHGQTVTVIESGLTPAQARIEEVAGQAARRDLVVVSTHNAASVNATTGLPTPSATRSAGCP